MGLEGHRHEAVPPNRAMRRFCREPSPRSGSAANAPHLSGSREPSRRGGCRELRQPGYAEIGVLVDADGVQQAVLRGNRAGAHTLDSAFAKAYTSASFKTNSLSETEASGGVAEAPLALVMCALTLALASVRPPKKLRREDEATCAGFPGTDAFATCLQRESLARRVLTSYPPPPYWGPGMGAVLALTRASDPPPSLNTTSPAATPSTPASAIPRIGPMPHERLGPARLAGRAVTKKPQTLIIPDSPDDTVFCGAMVLIIV